jgi:sucrose-6F-phosphate phosphohydrolase
MQQFLFVTDLDNTLVGDDAALKELNNRLDRHRQEHTSKIVYATGRSPTLYRQLSEEKQLLPPDALIASVGTEIYLNGNEIPDPQWNERLAQKWDRDLVTSIAAHFADLALQPETEQRPFKVSYYLSEEVAVEVLPRLESSLKERDLDAKLIYSGGQDLDILPRLSDKGLAVKFLQQCWDIDPIQTVVCGDSGNDISLFSVGEERGIIVGNARSELRLWHDINPASSRYLANASYAQGIIEGLMYFGFLH